MSNEYQKFSRPPDSDEGIRKWLRKPVKFVWPVMHMLTSNEANPPLSPFVNSICYKKKYVQGKEKEKFCDLLLTI